MPYCGLKKLILGAFSEFLFNFEGTSEYNSNLHTNCNLTFKKETLFDKLSLLFLHQIYEALTVNAYGLCTC